MCLGNLVRKKDGVFAGCRSLHVPVAVLSQVADVLTSQMAGC